MIETDQPIYSVITAECEAGAHNREGRSEGHNIVGWLDQYEATLDGFAKRLHSLSDGDDP